VPGPTTLFAFLGRVEYAYCTQTSFVTWWGSKAQIVVVEEQKVNCDTSPSISKNTQTLFLSLFPKRKTKQKTAFSMNFPPSMFCSSFVLNIFHKHHIFLY